MPTILLVAGAVVLLGALLQGAVGYGMNLLSAPLLALLDPALVPVPLLLVVTVHSTMAMLREHTDTDWRGVGWAMLGRIPGVGLGVLAVATLPQRLFAAVVGVAVLICLGLSVTAWRPRPAPASLLLAGTASGVMGTAASIGGPPIALLYQHQSGPRIRSTLAACFAIGSVLSAAGLAAGGQIGSRHLLLAAGLVPFLLVGFLLSGPVRGLLDGGRIRTAVLAVAAASAVALIVRSAVAV
ncbi:sulfite exporter TauE/SafE family protein [Amycolatopsis aidingensis]|uniref:sulfite exporter TauE/SafE family protein n=1 Tax=Amycolatopsis aidingensis TaxID=2842453 RepID=UPI001C0D59D7|nr:sulfite exporter TauE/SafE family protein [Amycolatopsis aidingensis]